MKTIRNLILIVLFSVACNRNNDSLLCESYSAPTPCERVQETWVGMNMSRPDDSYNYPECDPNEWINMEALVEVFQI